MINGNEINGAEINGLGINEILKFISESVKVTDNLNFSHGFGNNEADTIKLSETVSFSFNKGMAINENVGVSESLDIELGNLILHISDDPVEIIESLAFNLQKGILMESQIQYYLDLLIIQYRNKPKAIKHMTTLISAALMDLLPSILNNAFNLDTAIGAQLDVLGIYIGIKRRVKTYDTDVTLTDDEYRTLLKIKRATNSSGSSFYDIQYFIKTNLDGIMYAWDHKNMSMSVYLDSDSITTNLAQAIIKQELLPIPMGVSRSSIIYLPSREKIFGFRDMREPIGLQVGFNNLSSYHSDYKMLHQEDTI